jgi:hypothetical protein
MEKGRMERVHSLGSTLVNHVAHKTKRGKGEGEAMKPFEPFPGEKFQREAGLKSFFSWAGEVFDFWLILFYLPIPLFRLPLFP